MRTVAGVSTAQHVVLADRVRWRGGGVARVMVSVIGAMLLLLSTNGDLVFAEPGYPNVVPTGVGKMELSTQGCENFQLASDLVGAGGSLTTVSGGTAALAGGASGVLGTLIDYYIEQNCTKPIAEVLDFIHSEYYNAYLRASKDEASPGYPTNKVHSPWPGVYVQDFEKGEYANGQIRGDGWGAIVYGIGDTKYAPNYVGGGFWRAYLYAVQQPNVVGTPLYPGYPISDDHIWPGSNVRIQDFRGGSWGDAAIIGTDSQAWVVAGRHWTAYWQHKGQIELRNPLGPLYKDSEGWYTQDFEGGRIRELNGEIKVELNSESTAGGGVPTELPPVGRVEPTSPPIGRDASTSDTASIPTPVGPSDSASSTTDGPAPTTTTGSNAGACVDGAKPVVTKFSTTDGADSYAVNTAPVYYTIEIQNRGCESWDPGYIQVYDSTNGYGLYSAQKGVVAPGGVLEIDNFNYFDTVGVHTLYITATSDGRVLVDEQGNQANLSITVEDLGS